MCPINETFQKTNDEVLKNQPWKVMLMKNRYVNQVVINIYI